MSYLKALSVLLCLYVGGSNAAMEPSIYYFETECAKFIDNRASTFIGADEQVRILSSQNANYSANMNCYYTLTSSPGDRFMFYFKGLHMEKNDCANDWVTIYDGETNFRGVLGDNRYCGNVKPSQVLTSSGNEMTIYFRSNSVQEDVGFDIIVTVFHDGACASFETECSNGRCIHSDLICNGFNPCGDFSDCDGDRSEGSYLGIIIGASMSGFIVVVIIVAIVMFIKCKRRRSPGKQGHVERPPQSAPIQMLPTSGTTQVDNTEPVGDTVSNPPTYDTIKEVNA